MCNGQLYLITPSMKTIGVVIAFAEAPEGKKKGKTDFAIGRVIVPVDAHALAKGVAYKADDDRAGRHIPHS